MDIDAHTSCYVVAAADWLHDVFVRHAAGHAGWEYPPDRDRSAAGPSRHRLHDVRHVQLLGRGRNRHLLPEGDLHWCCAALPCDHIGHHGVAAGAVPRVEHVGFGRCACFLRPMRRVDSLWTAEVASASGAARRPAFTW